MLGGVARTVNLGDSFWVSHCGYHAIAIALSEKIGVVFSSKLCNNIIALLYFCCNRKKKPGQLECRWTRPVYV